MTASAVSGEIFTSKVGAAFGNGKDARTAAESLSRRGIDAGQVRIVGPDDPAIERKLEPETDGIARTLVRSHVTLGVAGLVAGIAAAFVLIATGVDLFAANPLYAVLVLAFFGTTGGLILGGLITLRPEHDRLIVWATSSARRGRWLVLVHARDGDEQRAAREALQAHSDSVVGTP